MSKKFQIVLLIAFITNVFFFGTAEAADATRQRKPADLAVAKFNLADWLIWDETSTWTDGELETLQRVMHNTLTVLANAGLDGEALLDGYRFRRWDGEFAKDKDGKIAVVNHNDRQIILGDTVMLPEYEFFIYHEIGHIIDKRTDGALSLAYHGLTEQIEGIKILHDWTTAEGYWMRGQAHVHREEATADAVALWIWVNSGLEVPHFHDMPESALPDAIVRLISQAIGIVFNV